MTYILILKEKKSTSENSIKLIGLNIVYNWTGFWALVIMTNNVKVILRFGYISHSQLYTASLIAKLWKKFIKFKSKTEDFNKNHLYLFYHHVSEVTRYKHMHSTRYEKHSEFVWDFSLFHTLQRKIRKIVFLCIFYYHNDYLLIIFGTLMMLKVSALQKIWFQIWMSTYYLHQLQNWLNITVTILFLNVLIYFKDSINLVDHFLFQIIFNT